MSSGDAPIAATVILPAHDEETTIRRTLEALTRQVRAAAGRIDVQIIVAANGCHDGTAQISREYDGVQVLELPAPSKIGAMRAADEVATSDLRIYLDADVVLEDGALVPLIEALATDVPVIAAPTPVFDADGASWVVRRFYEIFAQLPYVRTSLGNACVYGLSPAGRRRFGGFPDVVADDLFVQSLFAPHERIVTVGTTRVRTPRTWMNLVRMRTRVARGNAALRADSAVCATAAGASGSAGAAASQVAPTSGTVAALVALSRSPGRWPGIAAYVGVTVAARLNARRSRGRSVAWERDTSTRV